MSVNEDTFTSLQKLPSHLVCRCVTVALKRPASSGISKKLPDNCVNSSLAMGSKKLVYCHALLSIGQCSGTLRKSWSHSVVRAVCSGKPFKCNTARFVLPFVFFPPARSRRVVRFYTSSSPLASPSPASFLLASSQSQWAPPDLNCQKECQKLSDKMLKHMPEGMPQESKEYARKNITVITRRRYFLAAFAFTLFSDSVSHCSQIPSSNARFWAMSRDLGCA